jgi:hypothetical protein
MENKFKCYIGTLIVLSSLPVSNVRRNSYLELLDDEGASYMNTDVSTTEYDNKMMGNSNLDMTLGHPAEGMSENSYLDMTLGYPAEGMCENSNLDMTLGGPTEGISENSNFALLDDEGTSFNDNAAMAVPMDTEDGYEVPVQSHSTDHLNSQGNGSSI